MPGSYPGTAPDHHYLLIDERVVPLHVGRARARGRLAVTVADGTPVDDVLAAAGLAPLAERVPMLAYGANRSPHSLALKLAHHGYRSPGSAVAVPVLAGTLPGYDVVVAGLSRQGFVYADVTPSTGTELAVLLTLLDSGQAAAVHDSEGVGRGVYECAWIPGFRVTGADDALDVLAYAGCRPAFVSPVTGTPLAFSAIAATGRRFPAFRQDELLAHVLESTGITGAVAGLVGLSGSTARGAGPPGVARAAGGPRAGAAAGPAPAPLAVARELARLLNGQWWYVHNTGDVPMAAAARARDLVVEALGRHGAPRSAADRFAAEGALVPVEAALAAGPALRLRGRLERA